MVTFKKSVFLMLAVSLTLASCAKRGYEQRAALRDSVPLYTSPATVGGGTIGSASVYSPIASTPISSGGIAPIASTTPTPITTTVGGVQTSYDTTAAVTKAPTPPGLPAISSQEATKQFAPAPTATNTQYIVQSGDTIYAIGRKFNVHPNEIIKSNPTTNHSNLTVGQTIIVPNSNVSYPTQASQASNTQVAMANTNPSQVATDAQSNNNLLAQVRQSRTEDNVMGTKTASASTTNNKNIFFKMPEGGKIIQKYDAGNSSGVRLVVPNGTDIKAANGGDVLYVGNVEGYGQMVLIRHANGFVSNYAGLEKIYVKQGDKISTGSSIARVSGKGDKSQMMYELRDGTKTIDPSKYMG